MTLEKGKPYLWKSEVYGTVAVHFTGYSPNGKVANFTIDGGEASKQAQTFREMRDGCYFAMASELHRRTRQKAPRVRKTETPTEIVNNIREVPGIGKVATVISKEVTF